MGRSNIWALNTDRSPRAPGSSIRPPSSGVPELLPPPWLMLSSLWRVQTLQVL